jgi:hypothetical protein
VTSPDLWDAARDAAQADSLGGLPPGTREHLYAIARAIAGSGGRFTFPLCKPPPGEATPLRSVYTELAPLVRDVVDLHTGALGAITTALKKSGEISRVGSAKTLDAMKRRFVGVWQGVR